MAATNVADMSKEELTDLIEATVEQKLIELLDDPDEGLEIREEVRESILRQRAAVAKGERGRPLEDVAKELGLD
ncbi:MAG: hypothetical protein IH939_12985 [Acidobacteria bacterium]|nr:hypothetical protein [Acidobacteriota bacterium]